MGVAHFPDSFTDRRRPFKSSHPTRRIGDVNNNDVPKNQRNSQRKRSPIARSDAILELTWRDVDLESELIHLGHGHGNQRRGLVPINDTLRPHLETAMEAQTCDYVIEWRTRMSRASRPVLMQRQKAPVVKTSRLSRLTSDYGHLDGCRRPHADDRALRRHVSGNG